MENLLIPVHVPLYAIHFNSGNLINIFPLKFRVLVYCLNTFFCFSVFIGSLLINVLDYVSIWYQNICNSYENLELF